MMQRGATINGNPSDELVISSAEKHPHYTKSCPDCDRTMELRWNSSVPILDMNPPIAAFDWTCDGCGRTQPAGQSNDRGGVDWFQGQDPDKEDVS